MDDYYKDDDLVMGDELEDVDLLDLAAKENDDLGDDTSDDDDDSNESDFGGFGDDGEDEGEY